jgi:acyl-CoA hydrolase
MTDLTAKLASTSRVEMTQLVMPPDANALGTAFGGRIMQWADLAAGMSAMRHARMPVVTASIDQLSFLAPIRVGQIVVLRAQVNAVFGSSMEVEVSVSAETPSTGETQRCCEAFITCVALGPAGRPARAPILLTETAEQEQRAQAAAVRRSERLARRAAAARSR